MNEILFEIVIPFLVFLLYPCVACVWFIVCLIFGFDSRYDGHLKRARGYFNEAWKAPLWPIIVVGAIVQTYRDTKEGET